MIQRVTGKYIVVSTVGQETVRAFIPNHLPPRPPVKFDENLNNTVIQASMALGRLDAISRMVPDVSRLIYSFIRKEAVLSSQIEGTQSSLSDLLQFENEQMPGVPIEDVTEVCNYVDALTHGLKRMNDGFPLSLRLIREIHALLLSSGRGADKLPGEFRKSQNWIGGTRPGNARYIPPPPERLSECLGAMEKFIHNDPVNTPAILKAALVHAQFETIHPFLDGNGRAGRLLISLMLHSDGILHQPLLYLSLFFKNHRDEYYHRLDHVRREGDWEGWISFFLEGVQSTAEQTIDTIERLGRLMEDDRSGIIQLNRRTGSTLRVYEALATRLILSIKQATAETGLNFNSVKYSFSQMIGLGIVKEITGQARNRLFSYPAYLDILEQP